MVAGPLGSPEIEYRGPKRRLLETLQANGITDPAVLKAFEQTPRHLFVPTGVRHRAYEDSALPIGSGQTISQPSVHARYLQELHLTGKERVLEVGTGSGYGAAVLSRCCARVVTIERHEELGRRAAATLREAGYDNVEVRCADGTLGAPDRAPFDAISVTATAEGGPPEALLAQLRPGAPLVAPVRDEAGEHLVRLRDGRREKVAAVRFVPLVAGAAGDGA